MADFSSGPPSGSDVGTEVQGRLPWRRISAVDPRLAGLRALDPAFTAEQHMNSSFVYSKEISLLKKPLGGSGRL